MNQALWIAALASLLVAGCKAKKSTCEEARDLHVAAFQRIGKPISGNMKGERTTPSTESMDRYQAIVERMKKHYVAACEAAGPDEVLSCVRKLVAKSPMEPLDPACAPVLGKLKQGVDGAATDRKAP